MKYSLEAQYIMHPGMRKDSAGNSHQEDSIFPLPGSLDNSARLFVLCDGMGGHDAGEVASDTVCRAIGGYILGHEQDPDDFSPEMLDNAISAAFDDLDLADTGAASEMGTTLAMLKLYDRGAIIAHIGDSRVYHIRPGADAASTLVLHRTCDHSLVYDMVRAGVISEEDTRTVPHKNVITRALQPHLEHRPEAEVTKITDIHTGDYFYICSDGMIENMDSPGLREIFSLRSGGIGDIRQRLLDETEGNLDNHTAFIVHITGVENSDNPSDLTDDFDTQTGEPATTPPPYTGDINKNLSGQPRHNTSDDITVMPGADSCCPAGHDTGRSKARRWPVAAIITILVLIAIVLACAA